MQRLRTVGILIALVLTGVVVVSLLAGFQQLIGHPFAMIGAIAISAVMGFIFLIVALVPAQRYTGWARSIGGPNGRWFFLLLIVLWGAAMSFLAASGLPALAGGAWAFIGLLIGVFVFMGFIWAVIGE